MKSSVVWRWAALMVVASLSPDQFALDASALLNVNFTAALNPDYQAKAGPAAVGAGPTDFWNVYSRDIDSAFNWREGGQVTNLLWADGSPSLADLTVTNAGGAWYTDSADAMMLLYLYPLSHSGSIQIILSKLPPASYDVYVYAHGQQDGENGVIDLSSGSQGYGTQSTSSLPGWDSLTWAVGSQYVLFRNVQVYSSQPLVINSEPGSTGLAVINGIQLVRLRSDDVAACIPPPAGLVGWWPGEGTSQDAVGTNNGVLLGGATYVTGEVGQAFELNGKDGRMRVPASPQLDVGTGPGLTIEAWINPFSVQPQQPIVEWSSGSAYGTHFYISVIPSYGTGPGCLYANLVDNVGQSHVITSASGLIQANTYQHVALTYDRVSGQTVLYINGAVVQQQNLGSFVPQTSYDLLLGYRPPGFISGPFDFGGAIDEPSIYGRALSAAEIQSIYRASAAGKCRQAGTCDPAPAGLVGWWPGDGSPLDLVGGNSGVLQGGTSFQAGEVGQAFHIGGISNAVVIGNPPALQLQNFTINAWIKRASTTQATLDPRFTGDGEIFLYGIGGYGLGLHPDGRLFLTKVGISSVDSGTNRVTDLAYHHVAVTKNGATVVFYVDSVGASAPAYDPGFVFTSAAAIGAEADVSGGSFLGDIDEVQVFNRALTGSEVQSIFASGAVGQCKPPAEPDGRGVSLPGLAAYWNFDESAGTVAHDALGVNNGALSATGATFVPGGISGNALSLSRAANGFVTMGDVLSLTNTDFSVVAWVKVAADAGQDCQRVLLKQESGYPNGYALEVNGCVYSQPGKAWFYDSDAPGEEISSVTDVMDGQWHQIAGVYRLNSTKTIYVDGAAQGSNSSLPIVPNHGPLIIGGGEVDGTPQGLFTGLIDEVQIYGRALSDAEVELLFQAARQTVPTYALVSTLAGSGEPGYQDGPGLSASFNAPNAGYVGPNRVAYVADTFNHRIRAVNVASGTVSTVAGSGQAGALDGPARVAQFNNPLGVFYDRGGAIFVADTGNNQIRKISADTSSNVSTYAGSGVQGYLDGPAAVAQFDFPNDLVTDSHGNLFVTEFDNHTIRKVAPDGTVSTFAGSGAIGYEDGMGTKAGFNRPAGLAIDPADNLYVTEWGSHRIRKITPAGQVTTLAGSIFPGLLDAQGVQARFNQPDGIAIDSIGMLFITEHGNHDLRRIAPDGTVTTVAGTGVAGMLDGVGAVARFNAPGGLGVDVTGNLVVADTGNHRIRLVSFVGPPSVTIEPATEVVVSDSNALFTATASGPGPLGYQWKHKDSLISWATNSVLMLTNAQPADAGAYSVVVTSPVASVESAPATLIILPPIVYARALPAYYAPGVALTVELTAPTDVVASSAFAVQDMPPSGWVVTFISDGGQFDPIQHLVKFGPFLDGTPHDLSYVVVPAGTDSGPKTFHGTSSTAGQSVAIAGVSTILPPPYHPADNSPANYRITIDEMTAYANAWHNGLPWSVSPSPIPISYVTRAGLLWKSGETYRFDPTASPPLWWISGPSLGPLTVRAAAAGSNSARQQLPSVFVGAEPFTAGVVAMPSPTVSAYAVQEQVPAGVQVGNISDGGSYDPLTRMIRWGPFFDALQRQLSFAATVPPPVPVSLSFNGVASFDGADQPIAGLGLIQRAIRLSALMHLPQGGFGMSVGAGDGEAYQIESSRDLLTWEPLTVATNLDGVLRFNDPDAAHSPRKFYRIAGGL